MFEEGPYIKFAGFCESVIEGSDGVLSLIRVIDTITSNATGSSPPDSMPPLTAHLKLVVMAVAGQAKGRAELMIEPELPSGIKQRDLTFSATLQFEGEGKGANLIIDYAYLFEQEGLHWFSLYVDDQFWTRIPFYVRYNRVVTRTHN